MFHRVKKRYYLVLLVLGSLFAKTLPMCFEYKYQKKQSLVCINIILHQIEICKTCIQICLEVSS